ncbi:flavodoxin-dependent (E)-4-hydroxy-3-methylbut-2-enyl-diphosphate synthase [Brevundimonas sp. Root1423]|uniref:flavodoxin-dependent (E)-4-hydroxy-3-methylbut-2-enyl-diphosphate synthase n=1 Tax=Brevundimonas sp. Root1423 TaxID=1736462 RepID=UPI0006FF8805|nr:flavodoxin-dependent (E)-4-hydroxy-3-methylbut-2-enyl-diphosphate synthase [Brevundimonas sp. Root1423]KQY89529.1 4-hydroxy-3-methylbut-2-en-1-yl diphosphate synthase [Brevundimonas sp. Root1423]
MSADHSHIRPWRHIERRKSRQIMVGSVPVGGDAPISVQSMTNTPTSEAAATIDQIRQLEEAGADIVRVSCPDEESTAAFRQIVREARVPLVADIHFHYKRGIEAAQAGAACLRINPGNIGSPDRVREVIQAAKDHGCSMRIGVNAGSLERELLEKYGEPCPEAMVESALNHARILQDHDFHEFKISVKASDPFLTVAAYQQLAEAIDCPLHLGVTEAGPLRSGTIKSAIGMGNMLWAGIGDTIRVSLAADPVEEIKVGFDILNVIETVGILEEKLAHVTTPMSLSIIGCVVNGPGEALYTDVGFTGGGKGAGMVYLNGKMAHKQANEGMIDEIVHLVEQKAAELDAARALQAPAPVLEPAE